MGPSSLSNDLNSSSHSEGSCEPPIRRGIPSAFDSEDDYVVFRHILSPSPRTTSMSALPTLPGRKPPRPALPRPLNITAYTQPEAYEDYINSVLAPATANIARSSLTTIEDAAALSHLRQGNGELFTNLIEHEILESLRKVPVTWVNEVLFPRGALPMDFLEKFRSSDNIWDREKEAWTSPPAEDPKGASTEISFMNWLNRVSEELRVLFHPEGTANPSCHRTWDANSSTLAPEGGTIVRKPDLSLISCETRKLRSEDPANTRASWPIIQAFAEVTGKLNTHKQVLKNVVEKAYLMFESQPFRRYVIALMFLGGYDGTWSVVMVDRAGVVHTPRLSFIGSEGRFLAQVLYVLAHGKAQHIGIDETMTINPLTGAISHITVKGEDADNITASHKFEVVRLLHAPTIQLSGRATRVWLVRKDGQYYVLKDSWPLKSHTFSEIEHLKNITNTIKNEENQALKHIYPVFIVGEDLGDSTDDRCTELPGKHRVAVRTHRRIVTAPIGDPLTSFRNKFELCSVLCDVVTFLQYMTNKCRVCHGDISLNNIVINRVWDNNNDSSSNSNDDSSAGSSTNVNSLPDSSVNTNTPAESSSSVAPFTNQSLSPNPSPSDIKAYGVVIDNDSSFNLDAVAQAGYRVNSGTLPFMAIDSLKWTEPSEFTHKPEHDLESLLYVLINLCTYVAEPGCLRRYIPEPGEISVCLNEWWNNFDRHQLARTKATQLDNFEDCVLRRLPPYWNDFWPVLKDLRNIVWPKQFSVLQQKNEAKYETFLKVLTEARDKYRDKKEDMYSYAFVAREGDNLRETGVSSQKRSRQDVDEDNSNGPRKKATGTRSGSNRRTAKPKTRNLKADCYELYNPSGSPVVTRE